MNNKNKNDILVIQYGDKATSCLNKVPYSTIDKASKACDEMTRKNLLKI